MPFQNVPFSYPVRLPFLDQLAEAVELALDLIDDKAGSG
jgi:hypothetical protein